MGVPGGGSWASEQEQGLFREFVEGGEEGQGLSGGGGGEVDGGGVVVVVIIIVISISSIILLLIINIQLILIVNE